MHNHICDSSLYLLTYSKQQFRRQKACKKVLFWIPRWNFRYIFFSNLGYLDAFHHEYSQWLCSLSLAFLVMEGLFWISILECQATYRYKRKYRGFIYITIPRPYNCNVLCSVIYISNHFIVYYLEYLNSFVLQNDFSSRKLNERCSHMYVNSQAHSHLGMLNNI